MRKLQNIRLTDTQKKVLTRLVSSANEKLAAEQISKGRSMRTARDMLVKLGLITADEQTAALTDSGIQVMTDHNLTDDTGTLTDEGEKFAYEKEQEKPQSEPTEEPTKPMGRNPFESTLIRSVNSDIMLQEEVKEFSTIK